MAQNALTAKTTIPKTINSFAFQIRNLRSIVGSILSNISAAVVLVVGGAISVQDGSGNEIGRFGWNAGGTAVVLTLTGNASITGNVNVTGGISASGNIYSNTQQSNSSTQIGNAGTPIVTMWIGAGPTLNINT